MSEEQNASAESMAGAHDEVDGQSKGRKKLTYYERLTRKVSKALTKGYAPWQRAWEPGEAEFPFSHKTGKFYHGPNAMTLLMAGYVDPRWLTRAQAIDLGMDVAPNEIMRSETGCYYDWYDRIAKLDNGQPVLNERGKAVYERVRRTSPKVSYFQAYNAEQIAGMPPFVGRNVTYQELSESFERIKAVIAGLGVKVTHRNMPFNGAAYYDASHDKIVMPHARQYVNPREYYNDLLFQACRAVEARPERCANRIGTEYEGDRAHVVSQLRCDIARFMAGRTFNIGYAPGFIEGRLSGEAMANVLRDDPTLILNICQDAENIEKFCLAHEYVHVQSVSLDEAKEMALPNERSYATAKHVRESVLKENTPTGVVFADRPLSAEETAAQIGNARESRTKEERDIAAQMRAARLLERKQAVEMYRNSTEVDPKEGYPPCARRTADGERTIYPMAGADGRVAAVMVRAKSAQVAKLPDGVRNQDVFCSFAGMKALIGDAASPPPRNVKPAVIVGNSYTGHVLWHAGANVILAPSPAAMGRAAEALRAVRPDVPIIFALERGERVREPKMPVMNDGRTFENATVIRPPGGEATFTAGEVTTKRGLRERFEMTLQSAYGALRRDDAAQKIEQVENLERDRVQERELTLERDRVQERARGRSL